MCEMAQRVNAFVTYWLTLTWVFLRAAQGCFRLNFKVLDFLMDLCEPRCIQKNGAKTVNKACWVMLGM